MKRFAIVLSVIAVFAVSTTLYYFSYQLSAARREALPHTAQSTEPETAKETEAVAANENQGNDTYDNRYKRFLLKPSSTHPHIHNTSSLYPNESSEHLFECII